MLKTVRVPPPMEPLFERAQERVSQFFAEHREVPERAEIDVFGQRYLLMRARSMSVEFFEMILRLYADKGKDAALGVARSLLYDIAHAMGLADAKNFAETMQLDDPLARLSAGPVHFSHAGWAFVDISPASRPAPDETFYLLYDHPYSFESDSWIAAGKRTDFPVCIMNSGYSSGWCEASFGVPLVSSEILCRAKGDEHCRFIMGHPSRIDGHIHDYLKDQPQLIPQVTRHEVPSFFSRKQQDDELERREEQYRSIFEAGTNALLILDDAGTVVQANPAATRLFLRGHSTLRGQAALRGRPVAELLPEPGFFAGFCAEIAGTGHYQAEGLALAQDGVRYLVDIRGVRFRFQNHEHLLAIVTDITDQKTAQNALRRAHDELELRVRERAGELEAANNQLSLLGEKLVAARDAAIDASRAKSAFLANMSHELRTPLNAIIGCSELIVEEYQDGVVSQQSLGDVANIRTAARHLLDLINDILDVSKIEAGKMELFVEEFALGELIHELVATIEPLAGKNRNTLELAVESDLDPDADPALDHLDWAPELGRACLDRTKVKQIALNLLSNACKFTSAGVIRLHVARRGDELSIEVRDTGIGIELDRLEDLFEPFRQAEGSTTTKYGGTGLGLSISRHYAQMMQGDIDATSAPGVGSTFRVRLPVRLPPTVIRE